MDKEMSAEEQVFRVQWHSPNGRNRQAFKELITRFMESAKPGLRVEFVDHEAILDAEKRGEQRLRKALELAAVRLEILTGRMRGCNEETGKHELLDEAEMFCAEARSALAAQGHEPC